MSEEKKKKRKIVVIMVIVLLIPLVFYLIISLFFYVQERNTWYVTYEYVGDKCYIVYEDSYYEKIEDYEYISENITGKYRPINEGIYLAEKTYQISFLGYLTRYIYCNSVSHSEDNQYIWVVGAQDGYVAIYKRVEEQ